MRLKLHNVKYQITENAVSQDPQPAKIYRKSTPSRPMKGCMWLLITTAGWLDDRTGA